MRGAPLLAAALVVAAAMMLGACDDSESDPYAVDERFIASSQFDPAHSFDSLAELLAYQGGPVVVVGAVESRDREQPKEDATPSQFMGITHSSLRVSEVVHPGSGDGYEPVEVGDLLRIRQPGTPTGEFRAFRLLRKGEPVLVFLVRSEGFEPWFLTGPQGHYRIDGDHLVYANVDHDNPLAEWAEDKTLEQAVPDIWAQAAALP